ncbi:MAG: PH domain-containing protein [Acidobacteria bacterium]|nr:PH domain-containing protein [Acidobacteriota bacterium]
MSRKVVWRYGEERVITITPVARGLIVPVLATALVITLIELATMHVRFLYSVRAVLWLVLVVPCLFVVATRTWRWRSHKVYVTNQRVIVKGGALQHHRGEVALHDVVATQVDQRFVERLSRRGFVTLETREGAMHLGLVRHPSALCRLIDRERMALQRDDVAYDTVFDFDPPNVHNFEINPRRRFGRHGE